MADNDALHAVARSIRARRKRAGLTIGQLAELADIDAGFLAYIETGKKIPSLLTLARIAESLGVSAGALFGPARPVANPGPLNGTQHKLQMHVQAICRSRSKTEQADLLAILRHMSPARARALRALLGLRARK